MVEDIEKFDPKVECHILSKYLCFSRPKSVLLNPGPWKRRRSAVPKVPEVVFTSNASVRKYHPVPSLVGQLGFASRGLRVLTGPTQFGISVAELPQRVRSSSDWFICTGKPVENRVIPWTCHPCVRRLGNRRRE